MATSAISRSSTGALDRSGRAAVAEPLRTWLRQLSRGHRQARSTEAAARLSLSRYAHGYVSYLEVIDADRDALNAQRQLIHSRQALAIATVDLVRALGGGWTPPSVAPQNVAQRDDRL